MTPNRKPKLAICTPIPHVPTPSGYRPSTVSWEWHRQRLQLQMPFGFDVGQIEANGYEVGAARNLVVEQARADGVEWLFFLDYDVLINAKTLKRLMYRAQATHPGFAIYSGIYPVKEHPAVPILYRGWGNGPCYDWEVGDVLTEGVVCSGMGVALIDLRCFDSLEHTPENPWFKTAGIDNGHGVVTEDCWFTDRLTKAGGKILVDLSPECICAHQSYKTGEIFALEPDCPPIARYRAKQEAAA